MLQLKSEMTTAYLDGETAQDRQDQLDRLNKARRLTEVAIDSFDDERLEYLRRLSRGELPTDDDPEYAPWGVE